MSENTKAASTAPKNIATAVIIVEHATDAEAVAKAVQDGGKIDVRYLGRDERGHVYTAISTVSPEEMSVRGLRDEFVRALNSGEGPVVTNRILRMHQA